MLPLWSLYILPDAEKHGPNAKGKLSDPACEESGPDVREHLRCRCSNVARAEQWLYEEEGVVVKQEDSVKHHDYSDLEHLLGYFSVGALASYASEPDKYKIETDSFEGKLHIPHKLVRFGYRTLVTGELALAVILSDLPKSGPHRKRLEGFRFTNPAWINGYDERFDRWISRYLKGCWSIDNGPKYLIGEYLQTINSLTREVVNEPLFEFEDSSGLQFPAAENSHRYQDAHQVLYGVIIDGISKKCLTALAVHLHYDGGFERSKTIQAVNRLFPRLAADSDFSSAIELISEQRRAAAHGVRAAAEGMQAFAKFTDDLNLCIQGLKELLEELETSLGVSGDVARRRTEAKKRLPLLTPVHDANSSLHQIGKAIGKTVARVDYGVRRPSAGVHRSESVVIYFTDGSILGIDIGSNSQNLAGEHTSLKAEDFSTDLMLNWVPPLPRLALSQDRDSSIDGEIGACAND